ncbi:septum formation initiator family protein [Streptomyces sp. SCSIO 30461]|uniref:septum formation initiator family protein n=1 Tax=Streptomyces sp. SCSIO 30461 TaxID=3118085 RepID=UPI00387E9ADD
MKKAAGQLRGRAARLAGLMPSGPSTAARTPFVLLVVVLLGGGLITLLLLNSSLNEGSFELSELRRKTTELTDEEQGLQRDVDGRSAPDALQRRARELGMVPGGNPVFLDPDGEVKGVPRKAKAEPYVPPEDSTAPSAVPRTAPGSPSAAPSAAPSGAAPATSASAPAASGSPAAPASPGAPESPAAHAGRAGHANPVPPVDPAAPANPAVSAPGRTPQPPSPNPGR